MKRLVVTVLAIVVATAAWTWWSGGRKPRPGLEVHVDRRHFQDAARDALPPAAVVRPVAPAPVGRRPNFVVILADDLGYGDLGTYGARAIRTPNLDRLAAEGVRFTEFYASASVCSPSRAGLLTGRYPARTGVDYIVFAQDASWSHRFSLAMARLGNQLGSARFHEPWVDGLPDSEITLAEALAVGGYATGMVGKWHLGDFSSDRRHLPARHGFASFYGIPHSNDEFPVSLWRDDRLLVADVGLRQESMTADFTRTAVEFIDANADRPFLLYVAHKDVHVPLIPSARFAGRSAAGPYGDAVEELDWSVGEIVGALDRRGLREHTLVIFTSDNGAWFHGSTAGLRGRKGMPFEGGQRVPMIASWPGRLPGGTTVSAPAMNIDVFPTLLALAGLALPTDRRIDGRNLWSAMTGAEPGGPHDALFFFDDKVIDGVRAGPWKYYRYVDRYFWPVPLDKPNAMPGRRLEHYGYTDPVTHETRRIVADHPMLYDLRSDPFESYNLRERHPAEAARLQALIERWERDFVANPRGWQ